MEKANILIVDDEMDICEILSYNLTMAGFNTDSVGSAEEARSKDISSYDLLLLDVMLPGMSGFELAEEIKQDTATANIPIIFLTAKDTEEDTLEGFCIGADDYIKKPFSIREVTARVKAVINRSKQADTNDTLAFEGLMLHVKDRTVTVDGKDTALTKTEFDLLRVLLTHQGKALTRQQVLDMVWPPDVIVMDRTVDVNVTRLRKKIGQYSKHIVTRQGFGYIFENKCKTT